MKKFIVETYYTCTFKTVHKLNDLNDQELSKTNSRTDGEVEVIDVKLNNRKTKKIGEIKDPQKKNIKINSPTDHNLSNKIQNNKTSKLNDATRIKIKNNLRFKMPDREKVIFKRLKSEIIKFICILASTMMEK